MLKSMGKVHVFEHHEENLVQSMVDHMCKKHELSQQSTRIVGVSNMLWTYGSGYTVVDLLWWINCGGCIACLVPCALGLLLFGLCALPNAFSVLVKWGNTACANPRVAPCMPVCGNNKGERGWVNQCVAPCVA